MHFACAYVSATWRGVSPYLSAQLEAGHASTIADRQPTLLGVTFAMMSRLMTRPVGLGGRVGGGPASVHAHGGVGTGLEQCTHTLHVPARRGKVQSGPVDG